METSILSSKSIVKYDAETKAKNVAKYLTVPKYLEAINEIEL